VLIVGPLDGATFEVLIEHRTAEMAERWTVDREGGRQQSDVPRRVFVELPTG
jgi:hypothetical protein